MYSLGIDIGTTSISIVLLDVSDGRTLAAKTLNHGTFIDDGCSVGRTQDAQKLWQIISACYDELTSAYGKPTCIGLTGQMHGMLYVDDMGRAVSPLYTWQDGRGDLDMGGVSYAAYLKENGLSAAVGYGLTTHFYLMKNGRLPAAAAKMTTISDYIAMRLTGNLEPAIGADMAASWGCFDLKKRRFELEAMEKVGLDTAILPRLVSMNDIIGYTPDGVPVAVSLGDNQASVLGSVKEIEDTALINIGTGSQVSMGTKEYFACGGSVELRPCSEQTNILVGSSLCGGRAFAMLEQFYREATGKDEAQYDFMLAQAEAFLDRHSSEAAWQVRPTFSGTRDNPHKKGSISGIDIKNFHPAALTIGVIKGIVEELRDSYDQMCAITGRTARCLVGSGNALRRNKLMQKFAEDLFGLKLLIPAHCEEAAFGAALRGMVASGRAPSMKAAQEFITYIK